MKRLLTKLYLFNLLFSFWMDASAQTNLLPVYEIKSDTALTQLLDTSYWQILEDKEGELTFGKVTKVPYVNQFHKKGVTLNGFDTNVHTYWLRYRIKNVMDRETNISLQRWSDYADFYVQKNGTWKHFLTGNLVPWGKKDGLKKLNNIPVILQPAEELLVYERINNRTKGLVYQSYFSVGVSNTDKIKTSYVDLAEQRIYNYSGLDLLTMFLEGILLIAIFYNLFFFRSTRESEYLYFSLFVFFIGLARLSTPLGTYAFWNDRALWYYTVYLYAAYPLLHFFLVQFIRHFFKTYNTRILWDKFLSVCALLHIVISIVFMFFDPGFLDNPEHLGMRRVSDVQVMIIYFSLMTTTILYLKNRFATYVFIGSFPFLLWWGIAGFVSATQLEGTLGLTFESFFRVEVSCLIWFIMFFSIILFIRFNRLRKENAQQALDKERLAREQEMERSELIAKQKAELEKTVEERTAELKKSLEELKSTQAQLIQSEKMASLGELTAGIAHEIQNPLNFVNNFSDVNRELLEELKDEADKGNINEVKAIANDVIENEEKINHHGKRADAIVKGMLQHSRTNTGKKEPTDINALADEYLRLSYHGLRAKDKSFNADFKTDFDESIGKIHVVPQDIGRVLLNLFNNAFYAVKPPNPLKGEQHKPLVSVTTRKVSSSSGAGGLEIIIADNGAGIPKNIVDKIFQPFFTTKPTGQGTGLGLSLSYDIIGAHGGELKVESKEDEGSKFIIRLPAL